MQKQTKLIIGIVAVICVIAIAVVAVVISARSSSNEVGRHLELAQQYIDELNYEQAIAELRLAIEIDPKYEEAYLALAEVYVALDDYAEAVAVLEEGYEETKSQYMEEKIEEYRLLQKNVDEELEKNEDFQEKGYSINSYTLGTIDGNVGYICETYGYDSNDEVRYYRITEFDGTWDGNVTKETDYDPNGEVLSYTIWEYDENGNATKVTRYDPNGEVLSYTIWEYDENGNATKVTRYDPNRGAFSFTIWELDENGNLTKTTYRADGTPVISF